MAKFHQFLHRLSSTSKVTSKLRFDIFQDHLHYFHLSNLRLPEFTKSTIRKRKISNRFTLSLFTTPHSFCEFFLVVVRQESRKELFFKINPCHDFSHGNFPPITGGTVKNCSKSSKNLRIWRRAKRRECADAQRV